MVAEILRRPPRRAPQNDKEEQLVVTIKGVDVYDPTTGQIRSHSSDDIACWFIDTNYNGESFFVRHAYFTGGEEPYEKLKRALSGPGLCRSRKGPAATPSSPKPRSTSTIRTQNQSLENLVRKAD